MEVSAKIFASIDANEVRAAAIATGPVVIATTAAIADIAAEA